MKNISICNGCKYSVCCYDPDRKKACDGFCKKSVHDYISEMKENTICFIFHVSAVYNYGWRNCCNLVGLYDGKNSIEEKYDNFPVIMCKAQKFKGKTYFTLYI